MSNATTHTTNPLHAFSAYRFTFNGKEQDNEVSGSGNSYDYGFRIYNPRLGKFLSVDPLTNSYPFYTPYQFAGNTPIIAIDLDGLEVLIKISDIPNGVTALRVIGSNATNKAPTRMLVHTYPMTVTDVATGNTTTYSVTRDALYINKTEVPDASGKVTVNNIPFEPAVGSCNIYDGEERTTFMNTELPSIRLTQNGSTSIPAEPVNSPWRADPNKAKDINIHVGGTYSTSNGNFVTGSEGCFTIVGGNECTNELQNDINMRQQNLIKANEPTNYID